jgi:biotin/methionine sulfoxide reductase
VIGGEGPQDGGELVPGEGTWVPQSSHWGTFDAKVSDGEVIEVRPGAFEGEPSPILANIVGSARHRARVERPMVREGWLEDGPGPSSRRGCDRFVAMEWPEVMDRLSAELGRVVRTHGNAAIYGGSYGWSSAGRFHHAQSQLHRFLNGLGGYTRSVNTYSLGASEVILPRVLGANTAVIRRATSWSQIVASTELLVAFGGVPIKNSAIKAGGSSTNTARTDIQRATGRGMECVVFSPIRDDAPDPPTTTLYSLRPGTDVAVMLGLAFVLLEEGLYDADFVARYCVGFERFSAYLTGAEDGCAKSPEWAAELADVPAEAIRRLARRMATRRTMVSVSWSLQRIDHGEQAPWMGIVLAAMLGQIGLPGGGFGHGYGSSGEVGNEELPFGLPTFPQGKNPIRSFIPVSRLSDMLLGPGSEMDYNGQRIVLPDIRIVYWCGGNPFHHHQDLARLRRALGRPDTVVVHEPYWTAMARHADVVLPTTSTLEREDMGGSRNDPYLVAMHQAVAPYGEARDDYAAFSDLAYRLGFGDAFTEGRTPREWLVHLYERWRGQAAAGGFALPGFDDFWDAGRLRLPTRGPSNLLEAYRHDPEAHPLATPSGRIEIFSSTIESFGYPDCRGHPRWMPSREWTAEDGTSRSGLRLIANQPRTRLHGQLDFGRYSQDSKIHGREPLRMHPGDAAQRGIGDGEVVRVFNERGSCLVGVRYSGAMRPGVVQLSTGAWYDPLDPCDPDAMCVHGNPNVLTRDVGSSRLAQACTGQHALVEVERYRDDLPPIRAFDPPSVTAKGEGRERA